MQSHGQHSMHGPLHCATTLPEAQQTRQSVNVLIVQRKSGGVQIWRAPCVCLVMIPSVSVPSRFPEDPLGPVLTIQARIVHTLGTCTWLVESSSDLQNNLGSQFKPFAFSDEGWLSTIRS